MRKHVLFIIFSLPILVANLSATNNNEIRCVHSWKT